MARHQSDDQYRLQKFYPYVAVMLAVARLNAQFGIGALFTISESTYLTDKIWLFIKGLGILQNAFKAKNVFILIRV